MNTQQRDIESKFIEVLHDGYYDTWDESKKVALLKKGEVVKMLGHTVDRDHRGLYDGWYCRSDSGKPVFVETENGRVVE